MNRQEAAAYRKILKLPADFRLSRRYLRKNTTGAERKTLKVYLAKINSGG